MNSGVGPRLANREIVVYAVYLLGGDTQRIHTEDVALKCFELFPDSFSWIKYPTYPDKDIVRVALTDARKERYGGLVEGRSGQNKGLSARTRRKPVSDGWILTAKGIEWVKANLDRFKEYRMLGQTKEHRQKVLRKLKRIKESKIYSTFLDSPKQFEPAIGEMADLFRCRVDAEEEVWRQRFDTARRQARTAEQERVLEFIDLCEEAYMNQG
jgi:hypothetical protein